MLFHHNSKTYSLEAMYKHSASGAVFELDRDQLAWPTTNISSDQIAAPIVVKQGEKYLVVAIPSSGVNWKIIKTPGATPKLRVCFLNKHVLARCLA